ncbi:MAG: hypothetical protein JW795_21825 [Chitinivibrionales bacterium]|nr:hypothetical protein [Chitinivibrionales bacterium]
MKFEFDVQKTRNALQEMFQTIDQSESKPAAIQEAYVPFSHAKALDPETVLVEGIRGAGKSFWWSALVDSNYQELVQSVSKWSIAPDTKLVASQGFGASDSIQGSFPSARVLASLVDAGYNPNDMWRTIILSKIDTRAEYFKPEEKWLEKVDWVAKNPETIDQILSRFDGELGNNKTIHLILFDALDRMAFDWHGIRRLAKPLFQTALEMRGYKNIRLKLFVRPDMMEDKEIFNFPDAVKLKARMATLTWTRSDLYGMLFQRIGNSSSYGDEFRYATEKKISHPWIQNRQQWLIPELFKTDDMQRSIFQSIAGEAMAETDKHRKRGIPFSWLVNHLMDSREQVSPRSFCAAIKRAVEESCNSYPSWQLPIHYKALQAGVQYASRIRVDEITTDDYPWIGTIMEPLRNQISVPCAMDDIFSLWDNKEILKKLKPSSDNVSQDDKESKIGPRLFSEGYPGILKELEEFGVIKIQPDGRIQMPDVYRVAFGFGRKGGVKPLK